MFIAVLPLLLVGCGEPVDDPSAFTELGVPGPKRHLGWDESRVAWESLTPEERVDVLRKDLAVMRAEARGSTLEEDVARLDQRLGEIATDLTTDPDAVAHLDDLRLRVRSLDETLERTR